MKYILTLLAFLFCGAAQAQDALVVATCGTLPLAYAPGATRLLTVDTTGKLCGTGGGGAGNPGGSNTQVQYNNAGSFGGITGATSNGTTLTLVAPVLGTPASGTLTNTTGFPAANLAGAGTGVLTAFAASLNASTGLIGALTATNGNCVVGNGAAWTSTACPGGTAANPTGTAGPTAVNGVATTYMRSDGAPAVQQGSAAQKGIVQVDGTTITASAGVISAANTGTVTSVGASCGNVAAPNPITTSGTIDAGIAVRVVSTTSDTVVAADCGNLVNYTNAGSVAVTLPQAGTAGFATRAFFQFCSQGAGTTTITPTTSTIGGAATKTLTGGTAAAPICTGVISDGTNYQLVPSSGGGGGTPGGSSGQVQYNNAGAFGGFTMAQDCTLSQPNIRCNLFSAGVISSKWYASVPGVVMAFGASASANTLFCRLGIVPRLTTIKALGFFNNSVGTTNVQMAMYLNDATTGRPSTLIVNTASVSNTTIGGHSGTVTTKQVGPGGTDGGREIWFCNNSNDATATYTTVSNTVTQGAIGTAGITEAIGGNNQASGLYCQGANCNGGSSTFGTWPATLAGTTWNEEAPVTTGMVSPLIAYQAN